MPLRPWKKLAETVLVNSKYLRLRHDVVRLPNGVELDPFHVLEYPDWALCVCLTPEHNLVMVEQYRYGIEEVSLEFPAGMIETNENALDGAKRELLEETGYESPDWTLLGTCHPEPARHTNSAHLFVATDSRKVTDASPDESELFRIHVLSVDEVLDRAELGIIRHGIHLAAFYKALHLGLI